MTCPLCDLVKGDFKTKKYFEDDTLLVVDCSKHLVPMVVLKAHEMNPDEPALIHIEQISKRTGDQVYGEGKYRVRKEQRRFEAI